MLKKFFVTCLLAVFVAGGLPAWSDDIEDRFINPDFETSKTIFIDVKDASLVNVLKIFSQQSGLSFIAEQDVADKKITLYLNKIPLSQAMSMVLDANGLTYEMQDNSNVFVVKAKPQAAKGLITRVYQLKYATVSASKLNSTIFSKAGGGEAPVSPGGSAGSGSISGGLEAALKEALSDQGKVIEDTRTNSLIISDLPAQFDVIEKTIAKLDVPIPQVLIEVEMVDVSKSVADQIGIQYGATPLAFTGGSFYSNFPFGHQQGIVPAPAGSTSTSSPPSSQTIPPVAWNANGMTAVLNFLSTTGDSRILARPKILTLNNETAQIEISTNQAIDVVQTTTSTGGSVAQTGFTVDRTQTGVVLKVTPQANVLTREITMAVSPKDTDLVPSVVTSPNNQVIYDPQTREADAVLKLHDGQSMVIGGLMNNTMTNNITKLPFLGDLPLIGAAFRYKNYQKNNRELLIFLTPHIIDDTHQMALKAEISSGSPEEALNLQDAADRAQAVSNSLNTYDSNKS